VFGQFITACIGLERYRAAKAHSDFLIELLSQLSEDLHEIGLKKIETEGMLKMQQAMY
jgi:hypothetical protein